MSHTTVNEAINALMNVRDDLSERERKLDHIVTVFAATIYHARRQQNGWRHVGNDKLVDISRQREHTTWLLARACGIEKEVERELEDLGYHQLDIEA